MIRQSYSQCKIFGFFKDLPTFIRVYLNFEQNYSSTYFHAKKYYNTSYLSKINKHHEQNNYDNERKINVQGKKFNKRKKKSSKVGFFFF